MNLERNYSSEGDWLAVKVIAEIGVNHNGSFDFVERLISMAAESGADYAKFQIFNHELLATDIAPLAEYQVGKMGESGYASQRSMLAQLELSKSDYMRARDLCNSLNLGFMATAFDEDSLEFLLIDLSPDFVKIPSGEIQNVFLLRRIGRANKPVLLSTGMSNLGDIELAVGELCGAGLRRSDITLLHCTTAYPASDVDVNLKAMTTIGRAFGLNVGYSDHTLGEVASIVAVGLGARIIEKHVTLDRLLSGPDHAASMEPGEFINFVKNLRRAEKMLGSGLKVPCESESINMGAARKSLVTRLPIRKGEVFTLQNLTAKRPSGGIPPIMIDFVLGMRAVRDFDADELIELK